MDDRDRWEFSHGRIGVNAPSWLTFEVHRPYFDGGESELTAIQARGAAHAARLFVARDPVTPRFGMVMPASFRQLLTEESRLSAYRIDRPTDLPAELASAPWQAVADGYRRWAELDAVDRSGLAAWLLAAALPGALLELVPGDLQPGDDPQQAMLQYQRARALFYSEGLTPATRSAYAVLVDTPAASPAHAHASGSWSYLLARHAEEWSAADTFAAQARKLYDDLSGTATPVERTVWTVRSLLREVVLAERHQDLRQAAELLDEAGAAIAEGVPANDDERAVWSELRRRHVDHRVEIAVKRNDTDAEQAALAEGLELDPTCVKVRIQSAQSAERLGDLDAALAGYLYAARLGPYGTAYALLRAASCAGRLGRDEFARTLAERAFRAAPRSEQTRSALVTACETTGDRPLAELVRRPADGFRNNWHYRMYGAYFNLGTSGSPCMYAAIPSHAYDFAVRGDVPRVGNQRIMPPAFRTNLIRESGLSEFAVDHPAKLPKALRTEAWEQLCDWVDSFGQDDLRRQHLTSRVLFRLGFHRLVLELVPPRPAADLVEPLEFRHYYHRALVEYAASQGRTVRPPVETFAMVDNPHSPLMTKLVVSTFAVVFAARETRSLADAERWRARAQEALDALLASADHTDFEKTVLHSRFYRGVGFVPFMRGDADGTIREMGLAEELARSVPAATEWERFVKAENLHACLESRSKEAFGLKDVALGHRRTEEFLALDPYDPKSHIEMAESLTKQDRFAEAGDSYLRAARLGPLGTAIGYDMAGECFARAGDRVTAEDCFAQALRVDPYAISAARGWRRVAAGAAVAPIATAYADALEEWGTRRTATR